MWDRIFKKQKQVEIKNNDGGDEEGEAPEIDDTLDAVDAALAEADRIRDNEKKEHERKILEESLRSGGGGCSCW